MPPNPPKPTPAQTPARVVTLSNAVIRAGHSLTLAEKRLVMLAVSKLDSRIPPRGRSFHPVSRVAAEEYAEAYDIEMNTAYQLMQTAGKKLVDRHLMYSPDGQRKNWMNWVGRAEYQRRGRLDRTALVARAPAAPVYAAQTVYDLSAKAGRGPAFSVFLAADGTVATVRGRCRRRAGGVHPGRFP